MAGYGYDRNLLNGLSVRPFMDEVTEREGHIAAAEPSGIEPEDGINALAKRLHPGDQHVIVSKIEKAGDGRIFTLTPDPESGTEVLAPFIPGQYITVYWEIDGVKTSRRYTLASNPSWNFSKEESRYELAIGSFPRAYFPAAVIRDWEVGTKVTVSEPRGSGACYESLRDGKHIVGVSSAISAFRSMAYWINEGKMDCDLTVLNVAVSPDELYFYDDLLRLERESNGRIRIINWLLHGEIPGCRTGMITADDIRKAAGDGDYAVFVCSAAFLYDALMAPVRELGLPGRKIRSEIRGEVPDVRKCEGYPFEGVWERYGIKVIVHGREYLGEAEATDSLLRTCEKMGIGVTSDCRSGVCGWCRSRLISGEVFVPSDRDGRKMADKKFGWIHPCASYPLSDIVMEVFPK